MAQRLKRLPATRETWVRSLDQEDPLEKEMATHSSILAWRMPWSEEPGGLQVHGVTKSQTLLSDFTFTYSYFIAKMSFKFLSNTSFGKCPSTVALSLFVSLDLFLWVFSHLFLLTLLFFNLPSSVQWFLDFCSYSRMNSREKNKQTAGSLSMGRT